MNHIPTKENPITTAPDSAITYCRACGLMRMPSDKRCPRCSGTQTTHIAPTPPIQLLPRGQTPFTRYSIENASFKV